MTKMKKTKGYELDIKSHINKGTLGVLIAFHHPNASDKYLKHFVMTQMEIIRQNKTETFILQAVCHPSYIKQFSTALEATTYPAINLFHQQKEVWESNYPGLIVYIIQSGRKYK